MLAHAGVPHDREASCGDHRGCGPSRLPSKPRALSGASGTSSATTLRCSRPRRIRNGQIGEIIQITTAVSALPARIQDVGVVKDLATHDLDLTAWLAESPYATVSAVYKTGRDHEDLVAILDYENGIVTNHLVNWLSPVKERLTMITGTVGRSQPTPCRAI